jgi:hypothetical protein
MVLHFRHRFKSPAARLADVNRSLAALISGTTQTDSYTCPGNKKLLRKHTNLKRITKVLGAATLAAQPQNR